MFPEAEIMEEIILSPLEDFAYQEAMQRCVSVLQFS